MARKLQLVSELADQTARNITRDVGGWKQYLDTASRLYKYKFDEQLLIYIDADRSVTFYDEGLPEAVKEQIRKVAAEAQMNISATQEAPVFSTPTQAEPEIRAEEDGG